MSAIVSLTEVSRFHAGLPVLKDVNLVVPSGQTCAIVGPSGSGKSTLLNLIGLLDRPCSGRVQLVGNDMTGASADQCAVVRNRLIGFVFQSFNLLPRLSALDNVALPLSYRGLRLPAARVLAQNQLEAVGIGELGPQRSAELSGGQRQRVAIARALVTEPRLLVADEPTGSLDTQTGKEVLRLLLRLNQELGTTLLMVTHDLGMAQQLQRCLRVEQGRLTDA
ncbi:ABC transporter ATP-binding protein [Pseudomonas sp. S32]|uniref:ABC transporter ATP-binding protein n=1 Tax=Pseudomonas sp. S32 TaxID=2767448 RepID=UPI0019128F12|nr:ABC transporter ATP-binding protein [Pseudomonas sp. S32]MBK5006706.1 ABC transporter ATP-binding protein [Pseudomonas sp. S32]